MVKTTRHSTSAEQSSRSTQQEKPTQTTWTTEHSAAFYGIRQWSSDYFDINEKGNVVVTVPENSSQKGNTYKPVELITIIREMQARGMEMPSILRIENLLDARISELNEAFARAIEINNYQNVYRGVFPIKVNQQAHVIEEIASFGKKYHHGFEAGSKAELIVAISQLKDALVNEKETNQPNSIIVCNGYKDAEFIELGLYAKQMGIPCFFVLETPTELPIIIERAKALEVEPLIGVRIRPTVSVDGHWSSDSGDGSIFGLSTGGLTNVLDMLKAHDMMHCLQLLHCHIGSQVPNIRNIRAGVLEASRYYMGLIEAGAPMGYIDLGGGLGVDYEGNKTNSTHSMNYQLDEYCVNVIETLCETLNPKGIPHPVIITESGRATVAYSSMLLFNILDIRDHRPTKLPDTLPKHIEEHGPEKLLNLWLVNQSVNADNYQECYNDALYYRDEIRDLFLRGQASLTARSLADNLALAVFEKVADIVSQYIKTDERVPADLANLPEMLADIYYGNFSLFQSLPDIWAIDQLLPVMPIHKLDQEPTRQAVIADLTCDSDGKIAQFVTPDGVKSTTRLHDVDLNTEDYFLGVFLVGAYQETLGDLHNLFGDTNVVSVNIKPDGSFDFVREFEGDSIADVLSYVEYDTKKLVEDFRKRAEKAVKNGNITANKRREMMRALKASLDGYTYFEDE